MSQPWSGMPAFTERTGFFTALSPGVLGSFGSVLHLIAFAGATIVRASGLYFAS